MAVPFSNTKLRVPKGFQNVLEGLAREVLRSQPGDIFAFGAMYFEKLVKLREETGDDPAVHGAQMEDRFYNNKSFQKPDVDSNDPSQQEAALKIQTKYRQYHAKQLVDEKRQDSAAVKIQAGFRGWEDRKKVKDMKDSSDEPEKSSAAGEEEEVDIDMDDPEVAAAAAKIQAGFKGHKARKEVQKMREELESSKTEEPSQEKAVENEEEIDIDLNDPDVEKAATKIQAGFRGLQTRNEIKAKMQQEDVKQVEEEVDIDLNDPDVQGAAAKIQAGFRGHQSRKQVKAMREEDQTQEVENQEEEVDIDLNDPDVASAAVKIQAGFRGLQDRQKVKALKEGQGQTLEAQQGAAEAAPNGQEEEEEEIDIDLNDPEVAKAAEKIQAGFKGMKTRKDLKQKNEANGVEATPNTEDKTD